MSKLLKEISPYLKGRQFSEALNVDLSGTFNEITRIEFLVNLCRQKKVIHLGCTDHVPLIDEKIRKNQWLHKLLSEVASECLGVDIDKESVEYVRNKGYTNVIAGDITVSPLPELTSKKWDYLIMGEVLEHIDNPVGFLEQIRKNYLNNIDKIVITVPNVISKFTFSHMRNGLENINSDHRYWFTPYTILKVLTQAGFMPVDLSYCNRAPLNKFHLALRKLQIEKKKYPFHFFLTLVVTGAFTENE